MPTSMLVHLVPAAALVAIKKLLALRGTGRKKA
jgi:hypothetical protein